MGRYLNLAKNALKNKEYCQEEPFLSGEQAPPIITTNYEITKEDEARFPEKPDIIRARIVSTGEVAHVSAVESCFHCRGKGACRCAVCGVQDSKGRHVHGQCGACRGTGYLDFSGDSRCQ